MNAGIGEKTTSEKAGEKRKALGRGLEALLPAARSTAATAATAAAEPPAGEHTGEVVRELPLGELERSPYQPRVHVDERALEELAVSIRANGVVQPVVVRPLAEGRYQLIAGERRWLAAQRAGRATVPAVVRQVSNEQAMEMTIVENLQREDLNAMEQARAFERLGREFALTQEQIALKTGKERSSIANFVRLLKLPQQLQQDVENGVLSFGHAKALLMLATPEAQIKVARRVEEQHMSVRQTEELVQSLIHPAERLPARPAAAVDPNVREAERQLERALGVRVKIKDKKGKGKIILEYATLEDFDRVLEVLGK